MARPGEGGPRGPLLIAAAAALALGALVVLSGVVSGGAGGSADRAAVTETIESFYGKPEASCEQLTTRFVAGAYGNVANCAGATAAVDPLEVEQLEVKIEDREAKATATTDDDWVDSFELIQNLDGEWQIDDLSSDAP